MVTEAGPEEEDSDCFIFGDNFICRQLLKWLAAGKAIAVVDHFVIA